MGDYFVEARERCPHEVIVRVRAPDTGERFDFQGKMNHILAVEAWCLEQFGPGWTPVDTEEGIGPETARWFSLGMTYHFRDANDAFWFKIAWN
jgi:hypothetical protein